MTLGSIHFQVSYELQSVDFSFDVRLAFRAPPSI